ncbi:hypothetical protein GALMADRAFT_521200 [Galerina marginata CBS 339.88]|uniref:Uncharacterized protein n=1 Tax=Galerina marginata (strain CBS 339.88) TaxID=685588 RepID=A0A067SVS1_GALM3|nr:hypothetical protein GALMADRAFT_521200 [Galerina marginata CBS 339.88]
MSPDTSMYGGHMHDMRLGLGWPAASELRRSFDIAKTLPFFCCIISLILPVNQNSEPPFINSICTLGLRPQLAHSVI